MGIGRVVLRNDLRFRKQKMSVVLSPGSTLANPKFEPCGDRPMAVVLDIDVQRGRARTAKRGEAPDRLEQEKADFFERVRQGYLAAAREYPDCVAAIDADRTPDEVFADLFALVKARL